MGVYLWTEHGTIEYDFTKSDGGWTVPSGVSRNSSGFYIPNPGSNAASYGIIAPSEIYNYGNPKSIRVLFNKGGASKNGTGIWNADAVNGWYFLPRNLQNDSFDWNYYGTITQNSISLSTSTDITREMEIDSSTVNWTITHKITGNNNITDTSGVLKYYFENQYIGLRLVNRGTNSDSPYIKSFTIEY